MGLLDHIRPKWKHSDWRVREKAVAQIDDPGILVKIVQRDAAMGVRKAALERLRSCAESEGLGGVKGLAALCQVTATDSDGAIREQASRVILAHSVQSVEKYFQKQGFQQTELAPRGGGIPDLLVITRLCPHGGLRKRAGHCLMDTWARQDPKSLSLTLMNAMPLDAHAEKALDRAFHVAGSVRDSRARAALDIESVVSYVEERSRGKRDVAIPSDIAVVAVGGQKIRAAAPALCSVLPQVESYFTAAVIGWALGEIGDGQAVPVLLAEIPRRIEGGPRFASFTARAVSALAKLNAVPAEGQLGGFVKGDYPYVREIAAGRCKYESGKWTGAEARQAARDEDDFLTSLERIWQYSGSHAQHDA